MFTHFMLGMAAGVCFLAALAWGLWPLGFLMIIFMGMSGVLSYLKEE